MDSVYGLHIRASSKSYPEGRMFVFEDNTVEIVDVVIQFLLFII